MPQDARIRKLQVLPSRSADLCFTVPGVLSRQNFDFPARKGPAGIGQPVDSYDVNGDLYARLGQFVTDPADPRFPGEDKARFHFDAGEIEKVLTQPRAANKPAPFLFSLRNEGLAAALDQAIVRREGAYFQRFKHGADIENILTGTLGTNLTRLAELKKAAEDRHTAVEKVYTDRQQLPNPDPTVITETTTRMTVSDTYKVKTTTNQRNTISVNEEHDKPGDPTLTTEIVEFDDQGAQKKTQEHRSKRVAGLPFAYDETPGASGWKKVEKAFLADAQKSETTTEGVQLTSTTNPNFFHPRFDNAIQHKQLLFGLDNERMGQALNELSAKHTARIVADEQVAADLDLRRLQIAFAETFLTPPFEGVVTAVFKDVGECVQPGEPIVRVESDAVVFLVGRVHSTTPLRIGQDVIVRSSNLFESGVARDFPARIRSVRGHTADDDEWEILIECANPPDATGRVLPLYYQFDRDTTTLVLP
jgi:hypothetical protein